MKGHRLILVDRGAVHTHRYRATCSCGWIGRNRLTRDIAATMWREKHHAPLERVASGKNRRRRRATPLAPRPVTPADELPEQLRSP